MKTPSHPLRWIWQNYLRRSWGIFLVAVAFMAVEGSMLGLMSYMMKPMFDRVFVAGESDAVTVVGLIFLGIFIARAIASMTQKVLLARLSERACAMIRVDLLRHVLGLDGTFFQSFSPGYLMQRIEGDVAALKTTWIGIITGYGRDVIALLALGAVALSIDWQWTLIACIGIPVLVAPTAIVQKFIRKNARAAREMAGRLSNHLNEVLTGISDVKLNTIEEYQTDRYRALNAQNVHVETRSVTGQAAIPALIDIMSGIGFMGVLIYGGHAIIAGEKSIGDFMAFFTALGLAFEPLRRLGAISGQWQAAAAAIERIQEIFAHVSSITDPSDPKPAPTGVPHVNFSNVSLAYGTQDVLRNVSFRAPAGKVTAIVGPSGAGKTTLFNALSRLSDVSAGQITIDDTDIKDLKLGDLRGLLSVVGQDALLFDESLKDNITLGGDADPENLKAALKNAHVSEFTDRLPDGLATRLGPRGSALSGGQRQRVAIARALLRDTPILLLDEATSALDAQSEHVVQQALQDLSQGRTSLVIAHRLSTIQHADLIVVMDQGRVIETGTHAELLEKGGVYASLVKMQFQGTDDAL
jgi:ABC-type multidrug transport system fused ATPase/permease subunit